MLSRTATFSVEDLAHFDAQIYKSLKMIKETTLSPEDLETLNLNFNIELYNEKGEVI